MRAGSSSTTRTWLENADWVIPDFGKPGMEGAQPLHQSFAQAVEACTTGTAWQTP